jgi:hypothetical protein
MPIQVAARGFAAARLLGLWVRIPPVARMSLSCDCCVLSGRSLCVGLVTRPEESYRVWCLSVIMNPRKWVGLSPLGLLRHCNMNTHRISRTVKPPNTLYLNLRSTTLASLSNAIPINRSPPKWKLFEPVPLCVEYYLLGISQASELSESTFRNLVSVPSS